MKGSRERERHGIGGLLILGQGARAWRQSEPASGCGGDAGASVLGRYRLKTLQEEETTFLQKTPWLFKSVKQVGPAGF